MHLLEHTERSIYKLVVPFNGKPLFVVDPKDEEADLPEVFQVLHCQPLVPGPKVKGPVGSGELVGVVKGANHH